MIRKVLSDYRHNARRKGNTFTLTEEEFTQLITSDCYYCGESPRNKKELRGHVLYWTGVDRRENGKGYEIGNVVPCCTDCNYMKCERDHDEFLERVRSIYENRLTGSNGV